MADNYLEFSEVLDGLTEEEEAWLKHQLEIVCVFGEQECPQDALPDEWDLTKADWVGCRAYRDMPDYESNHYAHAGFGYAFDDPSEHDRENEGKSLHIYSEDWGNLDGVAHLVRKFLKRFRPGECWSLTWSETCSKPRIGNFGGGWMFVTAERVEWGDTFSQAEALWKNFQQQAEGETDGEGESP
ncbi:MAG TPA: hypothetical protein DD670_13465 [Planctomycetaceae bacterium]|nr:hypothetical protein [Planctomycetaceae bacterium]